MLSKKFFLTWKCNLKFIWMSVSMREREYWALLLKSEFTIWYIRVRRIYKQKTFRKTFANVAWGMDWRRRSSLSPHPLSKHTQTHFPYETLLEKLFLFSLRSNTLQIVYLTLSLLQCFLFFFPHSLSSKQNSRSAFLNPNYSATRFLPQPGSRKKRNPIW